MFECSEIWKSKGRILLHFSVKQTVDKASLHGKKNKITSLIKSLYMYNKCVTICICELLFWEFSLDSIKDVSLLHSFIYTRPWILQPPHFIDFLHGFWSGDFFTFKDMFIPSHSYLSKSLLHIWCIIFLRLSCAWSYLPDVPGNLFIVSIDVFCAFISTDSWCLGVYIIGKNH